MKNLLATAGLTLWLSMTWASAQDKECTIEPIVLEQMEDIVNTWCKSYRGLIDNIVWQSQVMTTADIDMWIECASSKVTATDILIKSIQKDQKPECLSVDTQSLKSAISERIEFLKFHRELAEPREANIWEITSMSK